MKKFIQPRCFSRRTRRGRLKLPDRRWRHGLFPKAHPDAIYRAWQCMLDLCERGSRVGERYYRKRGIQVCKEWHKFNIFRHWALKHYLPGLQLSRKDKDGDYAPSNCYFDSFKRRIAVMCANTGQKFPTIKEAAEFSHSDPHKLSRAIKNRRPFKGRYYIEIEPTPDLRRARSKQHFKE